MKKKGTLFFLISGLSCFVLAYYNYLNRFSFLKDKDYLFYQTKNPTIYQGLSVQIEKTVLVGVVLTVAIGIVLSLLGIFGGKISRRKMTFLIIPCLCLLFVSSSMGMNLLPIMLTIYGLVNYTPSLPTTSYA